MPSKASHLSETKLDELRRKLVRRRDALVAAQRESQPGQRGIASDDQIEDGDVAERMIEQDEALRMARFDQALLTDVDRALAKMDAGTYGVSEESGAPIPVERLEAVPWARRTADEEDRGRGRA